MISFDLKSGYHHIDIHPNHQTFLGFAWKCSGDTQVQAGTSLFLCCHLDWLQPLLYLPKDLSR